MANHNPSTTEPQTPKSIILFYKYAPLSEDKDKMLILRDALKNLCSQLNLTGRILLGMSTDAEGINGTLSGAKEDVEAYVIAMLGREHSSKEEGIDGRYNKIIEEFWTKNEEFSKAASIPPLYLDSKEDFKWSTVQSAEDMFPDLNIKLVKEIISTGGKLSSVKLNDTKQGYLTPEEWHEEMKNLKSSAATNRDGNDDNAKGDTILIDCRNHKEFEIGHFDGAMDPNTKTFEQFPRWVEQNRAGLDGKKVLMYCTGGIRCEKASAFIRRETGAESVQHLKGGIHKYLDKYGADGLFHGKNFVFDRRIGAEASSHTEGKKATDDVVGRCLYCEKPYDTYTPDGVCTVCREPTLVCDKCRSGLIEYHCSEHAYLRYCYFSDLSRFNESELKRQLAELEKHLERMAVGKRYKQKRKTIHRQCDRVSAALEKASAESGGQPIDGIQSELKCRNCGASGCGGDCWGFHGLGRKDKMSKQSTNSVNSSSKKKDRAVRTTANQRATKLEQKERDIAEIRSLGLAAPSSAYRSAESSLRCPPPCTRVLISSVKGKWCGKSIMDVLQAEFAELSDTKYLSSLMSHSLIHLNGIPVKCDAVGLDGDGRALSASSLLKNMDTISRTVHWHEPPVIVPSLVTVHRVKIPDDIIDEYRLCSSDKDSNETLEIFCCDKPASVPVHPAGPYLANSLTIMVEGQEGLEPRSLLPCHRLDRCTSGLTLCTNSPAVAKIIQGRLDDKTVQKLYIARVKGRFPSSENECQGILSTQECSLASYSWDRIKGDKYFIEVNAPIKNIDPIKGVRAICENGKPSTSRFCFVSYDETTDLSIVACYPVTGRGHQLRIHLQWLGHVIRGDVLYGGPNDFMDRSEDAIQALLDASKTGGKSQNNLNPLISEEAARSVKELCRCCRDGVDGIKASLSSAQLLSGGHAIDLHAWKYQVSFERRGRKKKKGRTDVTGTDNKVNNEGDLNDTLMTMNFSTDVPSWAEDCEVSYVEWL